MFDTYITAFALSVALVAYALLWCVGYRLIVPLMQQTEQLRMTNMPAMIRMVGLDMLTGSYIWLTMVIHGSTSQAAAAAAWFVVVARYFAPPALSALYDDTYISKADMKSALSMAFGNAVFGVGMWGLAYAILGVPTSEAMLVGLAVVAMAPMLHAYFFWKHSYQERVQLRAMRSSQAIHDMLYLFGGLYPLVP